MITADDILKAAASVALTGHIVDEETRAFRLNICKACDMLEGERCGVCNCFVEVKTRCRTNKNPKKRMRTEVTHCPLGRWHDLELANHFREIDGLPPIEIANNN